jgi:DNA-binding response OmpR family regulator
MAQGLTYQVIKCNIMMKRILIVDDNVFMVELMTYILNSKGYDVIALYTGNEVFSQIKIDNPDLIILDLALPDLDGRDICKLLKLNSSTKNLPVILCSGAEDLDEALTLPGAPDDVLHKPFDINALIEKVEDQLAA